VLIVVFVFFDQVKKLCAPEIESGAQLKTAVHR